MTNAEAHKRIDSIRGEINAIRTDRWMLAYPPGHEEHERRRPAPIGARGSKTDLHPPGSPAPGNGS